MLDTYSGIYIDGDNGLDGMYHLMSYPSGKHESLIVKLTSQFDNYFEDKPCYRVFGSNTGLFIGYRFSQIEHLKSVQNAFKEQIRENKQSKISISPDLQIICKENWTDWSDFDYRGYHGIPKLVVEVYSPSTGFDDVTWKKDIYEAIGISEYWVVQDAENMGVFSLVDGEYVLTRACSH